MRILPVLLLLSSLCRPQTVPTRDLDLVQVGRRMALVIGNSDYRLGPLKNPVNDALALERTLVRLGFEVTTLRNATHRQMKDGLNRFAGSLRDGDLALFYYAGHGLQIDERNYLVPVDFRGETIADAAWETLPADQIRQRLEESPAKVRMLILDACRNNPFPATTRSGRRGLKEMDRAQGTLVAFATGANSVAEDNTEEPLGLYAKFLISALETPGLTHVDIFKRVQAEVNRNSANGRQNPAYYDNIIGVVILHPLRLPRAETPTLTLKAPSVALQPGQVKKGEQDSAPYSFIPSGKFQIGCPAPHSQCFLNEQPRAVTIAKPFWMMQTEVTVAQYAAYRKQQGVPPLPHLDQHNRDGWNESSRNWSLPAVMITWTEARDYCRWAGGRLPTEEEWEWAALSPSGTPSLTESAWFGSNSGRKALDSALLWQKNRHAYGDTLIELGAAVHPVGQRSPNAWGLFDMLGNVYEWTESTDSEGRIIVRGGSWFDPPRYLRPSLRLSEKPTLRDSRIGFRCVLNAN